MKLIFMLLVLQSVFFGQTNAMMHTEQQTPRSPHFVLLGQNEQVPSRFTKVDNQKSKQSEAVKPKQKKITRSQSHKGSVRQETKQPEITIKKTEDLEALIKTAMKEVIEQKLYAACFISDKKEVRRILNCKMSNLITRTMIRKAIRKYSKNNVEIITMLLDYFDARLWANGIVDISIRRAQIYCDKFARNVN